MKKTTQNLIIYSTGAIFLAGMILLLIVSQNNGGNPSGYSASALTVAEENFDFGVISMKDGNVLHKFELKNEGDEPVTIKKVYTSCMCTTASIIDGVGKKRGTFGMPGHGLSSNTNVEVGVGESIVVETVFDPTAHGPSGVGLARRSVYLETNSAKSPKVDLSFTATVTR